MDDIYGYDTNELYKDLIEVLKKHQVPTLLAIDVLNTLSRDIICFFNTKDMQDKYFGIEILRRIIDESDVGGRIGGRKVSWDEILRSLK